MRRGALLLAAVWLSAGLGTGPGRSAGAFGHIARFTQAQYRTGESGGLVTVSVERDGPGGAGTVDYATVEGSATAGRDYVPAAGTLTFMAGERVKSFAVTILSDSLEEGDETIMLVLRNGTGVIANGVLGAPAALVITANAGTAPATTAPTVLPAPTTAPGGTVRPTVPSTAPSTTTSTTATIPVNAPRETGVVATPSPTSQQRGSGEGLPSAALVGLVAVPLLAGIGAAAWLYRRAPSR